MKMQCKSQIAFRCYAFNSRFSRVVCVYFFSLLLLSSLFFVCSLLYLCFSYALDRLCRSKGRTIMYLVVSAFFLLLYGRSFSTLVYIVTVLSLLCKKRPRPRPRLTREPRTLSRLLYHVRRSLHNVVACTHYVTSRFVDRVGH